MPWISRISLHPTRFVRRLHVALVLVLRHGYLKRKLSVLKRRANGYPWAEHCCLKTTSSVCSPCTRRLDWTCHQRLHSQRQKRQKTELGKTQWSDRWWLLVSHQILPTWHVLQHDPWSFEDHQWGIRQHPTCSDPFGFEEGWEPHHSSKEENNDHRWSPKLLQLLSTSPYLLKQEPACPW